MPLDQTDSLGINKDKSKNYKYCKFCFQKGKFTDLNITLEEKIQKNITIANEMGINEEEAKQIAKNIPPKLKRWLKN